MFKGNRTTKKKIQEIATNEQVKALGMLISQEKIKNIQKDTIINGLGKQLTDLKIQIIKLQGGTK